MIALLIFLELTNQYEKFSDLEPNTIGDFLAGVFAPLAVIWFVTAYMLQKRELTQNTQALRLQYEELKNSSEQNRQQAEAIRDTENHTKMTVCLTLFDINIKLIMSISFEIIDLFGIVDGAMKDVVWTRMVEGDREICCRHILRHLDSPDGVVKMQDDIDKKNNRRNVINRYQESYDNLIRMINKYDVDEIINKYVEESEFCKVKFRLKNVLQY